MVKDKIIYINFRGEVPVVGGVFQGIILYVRDQLVVSGSVPVDDITPSSSRLI